MSWLAVEKSLYKQSNDAGLGYPIIIENQPEDKSSESTPFIEVYNLPAITQSLDKCLSQRYNGVYQISVNVDLDKGKQNLLTIVDSVISVYNVNELAELDSCVVSIESRSVNTARRDGKFYRADISIDYFALMSEA